MSRVPGTPALLTVMRGVLRSTEEARAALMVSDWDALVEDSIRHGLAALVLGELERRGASPPRAHRDRLAQAARQGVVRALRVRELLCRCLRALAEEGIIPVLLKGYGLAVRFYPDPLARPCSDVDLLVSPDELPRAERALTGLGLRHDGDPGITDVYSEHHHVAFTGPGGAVDLHFRAFRGFGDASLTHAQVAPMLQLGEVEGLAARFLVPEDELVYLSAHAAGHVFLRLGWLLDIALLLQRHPALDVARVEETATQARLRSALRVADIALGVALHVRLPVMPAGMAPGDGVRMRLLERLLTEQQLVSGRVAGHRVLSFLLRALMSDRPLAVGLHVVEGALRAGRRAIHGRVLGAPRA
ncbi:MAG: nucleotidyltransferase family protein [Myxococcaceae bacterium]|nr:nucleotidyltransferase family protein [Myxococcaceae bacterium]MCI0670756.1 nucleotidyltransferase family protein [Myxococcaceae bacterium]